MAIAFREFPWYIQALLFVALAVLIIALGEFLPLSPVYQTRSNLDKLNADYAKLNQEVTALRVYERRYSDFRQEMEALQKQLETLKTIVPEEKELDEFIRLVQGAATAANVQVRRLTAQAVTPRDYHYEMPFEVQVDGPYYNVVDFFSRLSRLSRIINVGDISFTNPSDAKGTKYPVRPGTTVSGTFTAMTFFTKAGEEPGGRPAAKQPGKR
jgi:type IV pilus assembly protein PilO